MIFFAILIPPPFGLEPLLAEVETVPPAGIGPPQGEPADLLRQRIDEAVETETRSLAALREKLAAMATTADDILAKLDAFDIQTTAHRNLFLLEETPLADLERAWAEHVAAKKAVEDFIATAEANLQWIQEQTREARGRAELYRADMEDRIGRLENAEDVSDLRDRLKRTETLLDQKIERLEEIRTVYGERVVPRLREFGARLFGFSTRFETRLKERKTTELFERGDSGATFLQDIRVLTEPRAVANRARSVIDREIQSLIRRLETVGYFFLFAFLLMFAAVEYAAVRGRIGCLRAEEGRELARRRPWARLALRLFAEGLPLLGATLFVYTYAQLRELWLSTEIFRIAFIVLGVWLLTGWFFSFLRLRQEMVPDGPLSRAAPALRNLLRISRWYIPVFVAVVWLMGSGVAWLTTGRMFFDLILLAWLARFWRRVQGDSGADRSASPHARAALRVLRWISFLIPAVGLVLILFGFFSLSLYWSESWLLTFPLLLWGGVLFQLLREWRRLFNAENAAVPSDEKVQSYRLLQWLLLQLSWLAWAASSVPALIFAWYVDKRTFFERAFELLRVPLPVEGLQISFFSILSAILVILLTHVGARVGTPLLRDRFLAESGMNRGARTSVTLIAVYGFWAMGILIALNVLGVQSGHLAVVFGALGLGLGFGLQNIFSNFISGIILLFERPIQVGDVVEVNGTWAEVKNINVRATQVQTYDNASLLIPNSEFVSSTVINWSFKDLRIRRNIYVGVAYGSDVELVRDTILEIAKDTQYVLNFPEPLVYFTDFGDSALIFRLRFWTDVDNCLTAETNIRFAIDRLFRERGIEIAFPQRDIHIRTMPAPARSDSEKADSPISPEAAPEGGTSAPTFIASRPEGPLDPPEEEEEAPEAGAGDDSTPGP